VAPRFAGTEEQTLFVPQTVWLIDEIVTVAIAPAPFTVTAAAPLTAGLAFDEAMIVALPAVTAVTTPLASTVAIAVFDDDHVTVRSETPAPASTEAARVTLSPMFMVTAGGETVTWCTALSAIAGVEVTPGTVTLSPQAVMPAMVKRPTKVERTTRCILPPWY